MAPPAGPDGREIIDHQPWAVRFRLDFAGGFRRLTGHLIAQGCVNVGETDGGVDLIRIDRRAAFQLAVEGRQRGMRQRRTPRFTNNRNPVALAGNAHSQSFRHVTQMPVVVTDQLRQKGVISELKGCRTRHVPCWRGGGALVTGLGGSGCDGLGQAGIHSSTSVPTSELLRRSVIRTGTVLPTRSSGPST